MRCFMKTDDQFDSNFTQIENWTLKAELWSFLLCTYQMDMVRVTQEHK